MPLVGDHTKVVGTNANLCVRQERSVLRGIVSLNGWPGALRAEEIRGEADGCKRWVARAFLHGR